MKHLKTTIAVLIFLAGFIACKKENTVDITPASAKKLQKIIWDQAYANTVNFTYDAENRLTKAEDDYVINSYVYTGSSVAIKEFRKSENRFVSDIAGTLDNAGRMISNTGNYSYNINTPYTEQTSFTYDANGYLIQIKRGSGSLLKSYDFTVTDGDYTKLIYTTVASGGYTKITDYYTDKNDVTALGSVPLGYATYHFGLFGKPGKHLLKYEQSTQSTASVPSWTRTLTYTQDNNGYIQKADHTGTWISTGIYTYQ